MVAKKKGTKGEKEEPEPSETTKKGPSIRENWVRVEFKLLNWSYMNFTKKFKDTTRVFTLKKIIQEKHGKIEDLKICFHSYAESNEINDEMKTLKELGLEGYPVDPEEEKSHQQLIEESIPTYQLFYDFKPSNYSDPVILYFKS